MAESVEQLSKALPAPNLSPEELLDALEWRLSINRGWKTMPMSPAYAIQHKQEFEDLTARIAELKAKLAA